MKNNGIDYKIVKGLADNDELDNYRLCFERNGTKRDIKNLQWLHQQNLAKVNTIYYAMNESKVAAIYTAMPVVFNINGEKKIALQSIDTLTDLEHRGKGLFPKLAAKLYDDAVENGFELVYGFPNENSAPGFFKKLKWSSFGEAPFLLKPMKITYFIKKFLKKSKITNTQTEEHFYTLPESIDLGKNIVIKPLDFFNDDYHQIWQSVSKSIGVAVDRSAAYMNWRYVEKPGEVYSKCGIYIDGVLKGMIVFTIKNKHNGRIGYIMELIYDESHPKSGIFLLEHASKVFKKEKVDAVLAWCLPHSYNYHCFRKSGYYNLPIKFRPQHLFLGVRLLNESNKNTIQDLKNWYISYSDSDTV